MATTRAEAAAAGSREKVNGEGDLDYTITMNESEDDGSSDDATGKPAKKANRGDAPSSPTAKVNGKITSDEDSQSSVTKSSGVKKEKNDEEKDKVEEDGGGGGDQAEEDMETEEKDEDKEGTTPKDGTDKEADEDKTKDDADEEDKAEEEKNAAVTVKQEKSDNDNDEEDTETQGAGAKKDRDDSSKTGMDDVPSPQKAVDDDVVEIGEDAPGKQQPFVKVSNTTPSSSSVGAGGVAYMGLSPQATSLLTSSAMQLVQVQGGGLMYVPSSLQGLNTTASVYSGMANKGGMSTAAANNSLLMQQYMMNQSRAGFSMSPFNQGMRGVSPSAPSPILTNIPDKPTSSLGMIENIRWEVENHINIKPKYAKPNPKAELGHLTKWIFDLGSDLVKEFVYHDLVRIQHSRNSEGTLSKKEKEDFAKLQEIDKELNQKIGHLKIRLNKSCRCGFRTELNNVMYFHQQHAHIERGGFFNCIKCKFSTRQPSTFKFHMESMHGRAGYIENRPSFYECQLCPYETNYTNRLDQHKIRCQRQFRDSFNLHPSCVTGPEVNLCLENVFYYVFTRQFMNTIMPKQQQQQQAALQAAAATKIRDMQSGNDSNAMNMQNRRGMMPNTPTSSMVSTARQLAPKPNILAGNKNMLGQMNNAGQRFQAMSANKMNVVANQSGAYASRSQTQNQAASPAPSQPPAAAQAQGLNQSNNGFEVCEICGGYVKDRKALRIHFYYAHRIDMPFGVFERPLAPLYCATCFARFWTAQGLQKHIEVHKNDMMGSGTTQTSNGVAGKCISCGHRVPNILMHMRMVHNRELRHYLAALMCIFCGSRFSTKKEVESHMGKMHGVIVKNSSVQGGGGLDPHPNKAQPHHPSPQSAQAAAYHAQQQAKPGSGTPNQKASAQDQAAAGVKGKGKGRGSQCVLCNLSFNRNVDLTRHCMRVHHTCMKCGLVVVDKESLARHTCLHSASGMRTCQICQETGFHPAYYIKHMRDKHLRKCSVILRHIDRAVVETMKRPITISDSEEEENNDDNNADKDIKEEEKPSVAKRRRLAKKPYKSAAAVEKAKAERRARQGGAGDAPSKVSEKESGAEVGQSSTSSKGDKMDQEESKPDTDSQDQSENGDNEGSKSDEKGEEKQQDAQEDKDCSKGSDDTAGDGSSTKKQESVSDQQCEDNSKNAKRSLDDSESGENDSPVRKSRRTSQQVNENQD